MSERKRFNARLKEDHFKKLEAEAQSTGKSINDLLNEYLERGFKYDDSKKATDEAPAMHLILLKYRARCLKCGKDLKPQTWAMYGKGVGAVCTDCFIEKLGDKGIVLKVMKLKELKWTIKALEKKLLEKTDELRKLDFLTVIQSMNEGYIEIHRLVMEYMKTGFEKPESDRTRTMEELDRLIEKQWAIIEEAQFFLMGPPPTLKKKKKRKKSHLVT